MKCGPYYIIRIHNCLIHQKPNCLFEQKKRKCLLLGASIKGIRFFGPYFDLPTNPSLFLTQWNDWFSIVITHFWKPTNLPKNCISFMDALALLVKMLICRFMDLRQTFGGYGIAGGHPNLMDLLAIKKLGCKLGTKYEIYNFEIFWNNFLRTLAFLRSTFRGKNVFCNYKSSNLFLSIN